METITESFNKSKSYPYALSKKGTSIDIHKTCFNPLSTHLYDKYIFRATPTSWRCSIVFIAFGLSVRQSVCRDVCLSVPASICLSVCYCDHSDLVIFNQISSKFQTWIAFIKLWFKFEYVVFFDKR